MAPPLGTVESFAVLAGSGVTAAGGAGTVVSGDVGSSPTASITGFPPALVTPGFFLHLNNDAVVQQAVTDAFGPTGAYVSLFNQLCDSNIAGDALGGLNLVPGVYCMGAGNLVGTLTLNGGPTDVWVFKATSSLTTAAASNIAFTGGADPCNVFWQVTSAATLGSSSTFSGSIFAGASISLGTSSSLVGRAVAQAAVTLDGSNIIGGCSAAGLPPPAPPTLSKAFSPLAINAGGGAGGVSTLTITLTNPNSSAATFTADLIDTLPAGVLINAPSGATNSCGGTLTAVMGTGSLMLSGATIPGGTPGGSCTIMVDVTAANPGSYVNTLAAGALQTTNGDNATDAVATLTVNPLIPPGGTPTIAKGFSPSTIDAGVTTTLTIVLSNPNTSSAATNAAFTDTLPSGVVVAAPAGTNGCGGTLTATPGSGSFALSGGTIPIAVGNTAGTCSVTVNVTAAAGGSYLNTLGAGSLVTSNGSNTDSTSTTLTVNPVAPMVSKRFAPNTIFNSGRLGSFSTLIITLSNQNSIAATDAALLDALPAGVIIATPPAAANTCGGTLTAVAGSGTIQLAGGTIPAGSATTPGTCTVRVNVVAPVAGTFVNTLPVNSLQTSVGSNTTPADATLLVSTYSVPTLSTLALLLATALLALIAFAAMRRHARSRAGWH